MENITIVLVPENDSFKNKKVVIVNQPISLGRAIDGADPNSNPPNWIRFASKVVSRQHARITCTDGKFYVQDTKSSSGTFVNGERLSPQGQESPLRELKDGDVVKMGEEYNQDGGFYSCNVCDISPLPNGRFTTEEDEMEEESFVETAMDNEVRAVLDASVEDEFNTIWSSLTADINMPMKKLRSGSLLLQSPLISSARTLASPTPPSPLAQSNTANTSQHHPHPQQQQQQQNTITITMNSQNNTQIISPSLSVTGRNDNTVTLIKTNSANNTNGNSENIGDIHSTPSSTFNGQQQQRSAVDPAIINDCCAFVETLQWESVELKEILLELARKQDQQLIAFYKSLKGFPSSFMNVASKYAKYSKSKIIK